MTRLLRPGGRAGALIALLAAAWTAASPSPAPAQAPPDTSGQVMVTYKLAPPPIWAQNTRDISQEYRLSVVYAWTLASLGEQCVVFQTTHGRPVREVVRRLSSDPRVSLAQPIETFQTQEAPAAQEGDPYARLQHSAQALHLEKAHRLATGKKVRVAVVDTGVELDHPDLRDRVIAMKSFVERGERTFTSDIHGTAVAGLIAATAGNNVGIQGVAPGAEIYAVKACWQQPPGAREAVCNSYTLAQAVDWAITHGAQVLNLSLAGPQDPLLGKLIGVALAKGIVVVAADGGAPSRDFPASYQGVIGILGSDDTKEGPAVLVGHGVATLAAPSVDILTTVPHGSYDLLSGSSFATAQVSGIAALMLERNPKLTPAEIAAVLHKTARPLASSKVAQVDACAAVVSVAGTGTCD